MHSSVRRIICEACEARTYARSLHRSWASGGRWSRRKDSSTGCSVNMRLNEKRLQIEQEIHNRISVG